MTKKQEAKEKEYFEKMKRTIIEDLEDGRCASAISGSIGRDLETLYKYMREWGVTDLYGDPV